MYQLKNARSRPFVFTRSRGQSIPLIALMIIVLFGMIGLAVDVGNTYAESRKVTGATNAASIIALNAYNTNTSISDQQLKTLIEQSLTGNGITLAANRRLEAFYLDSTGTPIVAIGNGSKPTNASYIQVTVKGEVDTFFARLVGRPTLPVNATGYAGNCPPSNGVYPITLPASMIVNGAFNLTGVLPAEGGTATSGNYRGFTWRRVYLNETKAGGNDKDFIPGGQKANWLRWTSASWSAPELAAALSDDGTVGQKFEEVTPWPDASTPAPSVYPVEPGRINAGDWVNVVPGSKQAAGVVTALDALMNNATELILPMFDSTAGSGTNAAMRISLMGRFVIKAYDTKGLNPYFDLIYLGPAGAGTACSSTPTMPEKIGLNGAISYLPGYGTSTIGYMPRQYVVVLDVSGSMSMNIAGQGTFGGKTIQCTGNGVSVVDCSKSDSVRSGWAAAAWSVPSARRIYMAKNAILGLIDKMNIPGNTATYNAAYPSDQMSIVAFTADLESAFNSPITFSAATAWTAANSNRDSLRAYVVGNGKTTGGAGSTSRKDGKEEPDPYLVEGSTNGALGLYRASQLLSARPKTLVHTDGKTYTYRPVVVLLTDGISNNFFNATKSTTKGQGASGKSTITQGACNRMSDTAVYNNVNCQLTSVSKLYNGMERPVSMMTVVARDNITQYTSDIYTVLLSGDSDGGVGTVFPPSYSLADLVANFNAIDEATLRLDCIPKLDANFKSTMTLAEGTNNQTTYPVVGRVYAWDISGKQLGTPADIVVNAQTGKLSYTFDVLPRGPATLTAQLYYRDSRESSTPLKTYGTNVRLYSRIVNGANLESQLTITIEPSGLYGGAMVQDLQLQLLDEVCSS